MTRDNGESMENRPFESLTNDELWNAILKRRTSFRQRQLQFELVYRLHHLEAEAEHWKELAGDERKAKEWEKEERERIEKLYMEGP